MSDTRITVDMERGEFRILNKISLEFDDGININDLFMEVLRPMLIGMGYAATSILDGCESYLEEFAGDRSHGGEEDTSVNNFLRIHQDKP